MNGAGEKLSPAASSICFMPLLASLRLSILRPLGAAFAYYFAARDAPADSTPAVMPFQRLRRVEYVDLPAECAPKK